MHTALTKISLILLAVCCLASCYKPHNPAPSKAPVKFDMFLQQDHYLSTTTCNIRDSSCVLFVASGATMEGIRFQFSFTSGIPNGQNISCQLSSIPAGLSISSMPDSFGLNYTWYPSVSAGSISPGSYPMRITVKSPAYGTEMHTIYVVVQ